MKKNYSDFGSLSKRIQSHLDIVYQDTDNSELVQQIIDLMGFDESQPPVECHKNLWNQKDVVLITYGDSVIAEEEKPLKVLERFLTKYISDLVSIVHILPFYPYSSDDGFSVINYVEVNQSLGGWDNIRLLTENFSIMADLVINHCSSRSLWFDNYKQGKTPGAGYFIEVDPDEDLSMVVRPRTSPLLRETETSDGKKHIWCTFSHDQIDLDFSNPEVLMEIIKIIKFYLDQGISHFRLDAVAFLWKSIGTSCINLPETHEVIRLLRLIIEHANPNAVIITETNIPNRENLSYFGNANEAHWIYNFTLPPLILYTMLSGKSHLFKQWMMSMPPAQNGTAYFNFIASHDGIGMRPVEGILEDGEVDNMVEIVKRFGGEVSYRTMTDGSHRPYELNISLIDAMKGTFQGEDQFQLERFICAHAIMLSLEGVPAFYIHSLLGTHNDHDKKYHAGHNRAINRHNWNIDVLENEINNELSIHSRVLQKLSQLIAIRKQQPAFHPNATQFTLHFSESFVGFWRQSQDRRQSIFCIFNISDQYQEIPLHSINLIALDEWYDLISLHKYADPGETLQIKPYEFVWITNYTARN